MGRGSGVEFSPPKRGYQLPCLGLIAAGAWLAMPVTAGAQPSSLGNRTIPTFSLGAFIVGEVEVPQLFFAETRAGGNGKLIVEYRELPIARESVPSLVKVPLTPPPKLYVQSSRAGSGQPEFVPYLDVPNPKAGSSHLLLFHHGDKGQPLHELIESSPGRHPPGTVRVLNLTSQRIAFSVGGSATMVAPGQDAIARPVPKEDGHFPLVHYEDRPGQPPYEAPAKFFRFRRPGQRLLAIFAPVPVLESTDAARDDEYAELNKVFRPQLLWFVDKVEGEASAGATNLLAGTASPRPVESSGDGASPPVPSALRECELGVLALGPGWAGQTVQLEVEGRGARLRAPLEPGGVVPLKIPVEGDATLAFYSGEVSLGRGAIGSQTTRALLALAPPAQPGDPATSKLFESSDQSHPPGSLRIFNLTPYQMAYTTGGPPVYVSPQSSAIVEKAGGQSGEIGLKLALEVEGRWKLVDQSSHRAPAQNEKAGIFVFPAGDSNFEVVQKSL